MNSIIYKHYQISWWSTTAVIYPMIQQWSIQTYALVCDDICFWIMNLMQNVHFKFQWYNSGSYRHTCMWWYSFPIYEFDTKHELQSNDVYEYVMYLDIDDNYQLWWLIIPVNYENWRHVSKLMFVNKVHECLFHIVSIHLPWVQ